MHPLMKNLNRPSNHILKLLFVLLLSRYWSITRKTLKDFCIMREVQEKSKKENRHSNANYPLSKGINAVCIGGCTSYGTHTRGEYLEIESLVPGLRFVLAVMDAFYKR